MVNARLGLSVVCSGVEAIALNQSQIQICDQEYHFSGINGFRHVLLITRRVEYAKGVLLFVMAPDDDRSGAFYIYDRKRGRFWLLDLADGVFGGYSRREMRRKIREFRLLAFAENPARLVPARQS